MKKHLDTSTKIGRIVYSMKDISVRMKPDVRAIVIRVFNVLDDDQESSQLKFRLRDDLTRLSREPQLASLVRMLFKALPST